MKLSQNTSSEAIHFGNVQNNKVGIDRNNIDFITTLLTSNLYSNPIQSFIRETVANGWDSQVEAGNTETPLLIRITKDQSNINIAIRDYGTGLSPERFQEVYLNVGSSTKRDSNDYIGQMGIGRFACLSCADVANITSYYNGICYQYLMYKDGGSICIDKLNEMETPAKNGVEVQVTVGDSYDYHIKELIKDGISALHFYPNVYISDESGVLTSQFVEDFNKRKIHSFEHFKVVSSNHYTNIMALMGNVLYPIDSTLIDTFFPDHPPIAITCPIGSLDVTPNRESLLYNKKTKDTLQECLANALGEIREVCNTSFHSDFDTIHEWYQYLRVSYRDVVLYSFGDYTVRFSISSSNIKHYCPKFNDSTINGKPIPQDLEDLYTKFLWTGIPSNVLTYVYKYGKFYSSKGNTYYIQGYLTRYMLEGDPYVYAINEPFKSRTKQYLVKKLNSASGIFFVNSKNLFKYFVKSVKTFAKAYTNSKITPTLRFIWQDFTQNYMTLPSFNNSDVPDDFVDKTKSTVSTTRQAARKYVIYQLIPSNRYNYAAGHAEITTDSTSFTLETLASRNRTVFYADRDSKTLRTLYDLFREVTDLLHYTLFVEVAPTNRPLLANLKNTVDIVELETQKNSLLSKLCTVYWLHVHYHVAALQRSVYAADYLKKYIPDIKLNTQLDTYITWWTNLIRYCSRNSEAMELLRHYYELYNKNNWLDNNFIQNLQANPLLLDLRALYGKLSSEPFLAADVAVSTFLHRGKRGIASLPKWEMINSTINKLNTYEPIQIKQPSSTDA